MRARPTTSQFSTTRQRRRPSTAAWIRRSEPPCVTTTTRSPGCALGDPPRPRAQHRARACASASPRRSNCGRASRSPRVRPSQEPQFALAQVGIEARPAARAARRRSPPSRRARDEVARVDRRRCSSPASCSRELRACARPVVVQRRVGVALAAAARGSSRSRRGGRGGSSSRAATLAAPWISACATRVCVVTGSTGGIGLETARLLAAEGAPRRHDAAGGEAPGVGEALHVAADLARAAASPSGSSREAEQRSAASTCS